MIKIRKYIKYILYEKSIIMIMIMSSIRYLFIRTLPLGLGQKPVSGKFRKHEGSTMHARAVIS